MIIRFELNTQTKELTVFPYGEPDKEVLVDLDNWQLMYKELKQTLAACIDTYCGPVETDSLKEELWSD